MSKAELTSAASCMSTPKATVLLSFSMADNRWGCHIAVSKDAQDLFKDVKDLLGSSQ
jgi:hypothetical protein